MAKYITTYLKGIWLGWLFCRMLYQYKTLGCKSFIIYGFMIFIWIIWIILDIKSLREKNND